MKETLHIYTNAQRLETKETTRLFTHIDTHKNTYFSNSLSAFKENFTYFFTDVYF